MTAPETGIKVRFYRIGHGDCFLLATKKPNGTAYILIDCGNKPGSPAFVKGKGLSDIVKHIHDACGGHLDLVIITHEHQDHVNGIWKKKNAYFKDFTIDKAWFAWTENPKDDKANDLREKHKDVLLGLIAGRNALAMHLDKDHASLKRIDELLALDTGVDLAEEGAEALLGAAENPANSINKQGMKLVKDKATGGVEYFKPGDRPTIPGTDIGAYVLGPPYDDKALGEEDPKGPMAFPDTDHDHSFAAAARSKGETNGSPFSAKYRISESDPCESDLTIQALYGAPKFKALSVPDIPDRDSEIDDGAPWRQIEEEWLYSSEAFALALNRGINNTSLVLAFELPQTKKILLFVGDAQLGNWTSWTKPKWDVEGKTVDAKDILARTVLYKVGHHGSHNATLNGTLADPHPNLEWMAQGPHAREFTAMITAVRKWAVEEADWNHPLPSIAEALTNKCEGRVIQTDTDLPVQPAGVSDADWKKFTDRFTSDDFYFELTILDE